MSAERDRDLWSGAEDIELAFEALGAPYDCPITTYLQAVGRVIVKNDPSLVEIFGQDAVDRYEALLAAEATS